MSEIIEVTRYTARQSAEWNEFVERSKNGTFLFHRSYMDYHADRFDGLAQGATMCVTSRQ